MFCYMMESSYDDRKKAHNMPSFTEQDIEQARIMLRDSTAEDDIVAALDILGALQSVDAVT